LMIEEYRDWLDIIKYVGMLTAIFGVIGWLNRAMRDHVNNLSAHMTMINQTVVNMQADIQRVNRALERHADHSQELRQEITGRIDVVEKRVSTVTMRKGDKNG
jgi:hypothetical protein